MNSWRTVIATGLSILFLICMASAQSPIRSEPVSLHSNPPVIFDRIMSTMHDSLELSKLGDGSAKQNAWKEAADYYQQALDKWANNQSALYGMAEYSHLAGNPAKEIGYYRSAIYLDTPKGRCIQESNLKRLMEYVLLLNQSSQTDEALLIYHYAAARLNYQDGKQNLRVLLPALGLAPGQLPYTPERLQALAHLGIAIHSQDDQEKRAHLDEAIRLQPDMAPAYFYKGQALRSQNGHLREARDAFQVAARYGDTDTRTAVDKVMKEGDVEGHAQAEQAGEDQHKKEAAQKK